MTTLEQFNGPRKAATGQRREPEYWCLRCTVQRWRAGGATELGRHQAVHGGRESFPSFELIDTDGFVLDFEGCRLKIDRKPVRASIGVTGWVRSRAAVVGVVSDRMRGAE